MDKIVSRTVSHYTSVEVSKNRRMVSVFCGPANTEGIDKVAEFDICLVWDMIRDAVATADAGFMSNPGLFRRKGEAAASILHTNRLFMKGVV